MSFNHTPKGTKRKAPSHRSTRSQKPTPMCDNLTTQQPKHTISERLAYTLQPPSGNKQVVPVGGGLGSLVGKGTPGGPARNSQ